MTNFPRRWSTFLLFSYYSVVLLLLSSKLRQNFPKIDKLSEKKIIRFLLQSNFFEEYRIEGKDETNNIYLELMPDNLTRAMKSASSAQAVKIKLTKKHTPCLTFEITLVSWLHNFNVFKKFLNFAKLRFYKLLFKVRKIWFKVFYCISWISKPAPIF